MELNDFILERKNSGLLTAIDDLDLFEKAKEYIDSACQDAENLLDPTGNFRPYINYNKFAKDLFMASLVKLQEEDSSVLKNVDLSNIKLPELDEDEERLEAIDSFEGKTSENYEDRKQEAIESLYSVSADLLNELENSLGISWKIQNYYPMDFNKENYKDSPDYIIVDSRDTLLLEDDLANLNKFVRDNKVKAVVVLADSSDHKNYLVNKALENVSRAPLSSESQKPEDVFRGKFLMRCEDNLPDGVNFFALSPAFLTKYTDSMREDLVDRVDSGRVMVFGRNSNAKESVVSAIMQSKKELGDFER